MNYFRRALHYLRPYRGYAGGSVTLLLLSTFAALLVPWPLKFLVDNVLSGEPLLRNSAAGYAPKPDYRPLTKFENRGLKLGHGVWDVVFERR